MALRTAPSFIGQIVITTGVNDVVYWFETGGYNLSTTLTAGTYWPDALASHIATIMGTESALSGATNTYTGSFDISTGLFTFTLNSGAATWNFKLTTSQTDNVLTGGVVDTAGDTLSTGQYGDQHLGWLIAAASPSVSTTDTSDQVACCSWIPSLPPASDSEEAYQQTAAEAIAEDGSGDVYVFTDWVIDKDEFPLYGGDWQTRDLRFDRMTQSDTTWYLSQFWGPHAGSGGKFRFYPDKSDSATYYTCRLREDGLRQANRGARLTGYALWSITVPMRRAPA